MQLGMEKQERQVSFVTKINILGSDQFEIEGDMLIMK
jgi:hypothetical protein